MHKSWARAEQSLTVKEAHEIFPKDHPLPRRLSFNASFEKEQPAMGLLLGWEYGRMWLKEHKQFMHKEKISAKPMFIEPDFVWWVNKRATVLDRRQIFSKSKQNPHTKNCNLSAFATSKTHRQKRAHNEDAQKDNSTHASSDQRVGGGLEKKSHSAGRKKDPQRKSTPWYY